MKSEDFLNTSTHLLGVILTLSLSWLLFVPAATMTWREIMAVTIFFIGMLLMYSASTIYHWCARFGERVRRCLRTIDHIGIYVMIAASYTPVCLCAVGGWMGWLVFGLLWLTVVCGAFYKIFFLGRWPALSLGIYLAMGWSGVLIAVPVYQNVPSTAIWWILTEGLLYTSGTWFYARDSRPYYHAIWHLFVLAGSVAHFVAVYNMLVN